LEAVFGFPVASGGVVELHEFAEAGIVQSFSHFSATLKTGKVVG
jgi:hypothetical protein